MSSRRLLAICSYPPPFVGGSVVYIYNLLSGLRAPVDVLTRTLQADERDIAPEPHVRLLRRRFFYRGGDSTPFRLVLMFVALNVYLPWLLLHGRYRYALLNMEIVWNSLFIVWGRLLGTKVIGVAYAEEITMSLMGSGLKHRMKRALIRNVYTRADGFVTVCAFTRDLLIEAGMPSERVVVIPPALSENKAAAPHARADFSPHVLTVGRLVERKGFHHVIDAVARLAPRVPGLRLTIVGDGPWRARLQAEIDRLGLGDRAAILTGASDEQLASLYAGCDLFVLGNMMMPDGNCEGAPTVLLEASAHGVPVIAGRQGGAADVVDDGRTGLLVDPSDVDALAEAMRRLLTDREMAASFGAAGIEKVARRHTPAAMGRALEAFVEAHL